MISRPREMPKLPKTQVLLWRKLFRHRGRIRRCRSLKPDMSSGIYITRHYPLATAWRWISRDLGAFKAWGARSYELTFATAKPAAATRQLLSPPSTACKSDPNRDSIAISAEDVRRADATLSRPLTRARQSSWKGDHDVRRRDDWDFCDASCTVTVKSSLPRDIL